MATQEKQFTSDTQYYRKFNIKGYHEYMRFLVMIIFQDFSGKARKDSGKLY